MLKISALVVLLAVNVNVLIGDFVWKKTSQAMSAWTPEGCDFKVGLGMEIILSITCFDRHISGVSSSGDKKMLLIW